MRKRIGARECAAAALIVGVAMLYWMRPASPPVTVAPAAEASTTEGAP